MAIAGRLCYTGHEHLDEFGLIDMNGRMYDPVLGRFLSPDPFVQMPDFSQNFNRYAYCLNNPLRYSDPSGEFFFGILNFAKDLFVNTFVKSWTQGINAWTNGSNWSSTVNGFKIDYGLVQGNVGQILSRLTWELPQTVLGYAIAGIQNTFNHTIDTTSHILMPRKAQKIEG
jgi:RHS repeat-associated protein